MATVTVTLRGGVFSSTDGTTWRRVDLPIPPTREQVAAIMAELKMASSR